jgi:predicted TIM-barrel fold metal-dependent hydrolase
MFGTDWPQPRQDQALAQVDGLGLSEQARASFLGGVAAQVFQLPAGRG